MSDTQNFSRQVIDELIEIVGTEYVLSEESDLLVYEYDGSADKGLPVVVILPENAEQVSKAIMTAARHDVPVIARGAGTGLSGGAVADEGGIVIGMSRLKKILEVDVDNRYAVVEPGVVNLDLSTPVSYTHLRAHET